MVFLALAAIAGATVAAGESADQPLAEVSPAAVRQRELDRLTAFLDKLSKLEREIDRSRFDLDALLDRTEYDAQAIAAFVRDEIGFQQYRGVLRGAQGTLISGAGNALDQALLLATLLNDAGYEARIVRGQLSEAQAQRLVNGIRKARSDIHEIARDPAIWQARLEELYAIADVPPPKQFGPLEDEPFFALTKSTAENIIASLQGAGVTLGQSDGSWLIEEARQYYWVQSRVAAADGWRSYHPAFGGQEAPAVEPMETFAGSLPTELQHRLRVSVYIEQKIGNRLKTVRVAGPWERPVSNMNGVVLTFSNQPNTLDAEALDTGVAAAVARANLFVPMLNGTPGTPFDLNGTTIDLSALSMDAFGAAGVFQQVGEKAESAGEALSALGSGETDQTPELRVLSAQWIEYTFIRPGGEETTYHRVVLDRVGPATRDAGQVDLEPMDEADVRRALTVQHRFMIASGHYSEAYAASRAFQHLIATGPAWRMFLGYLYGEEFHIDPSTTPDPSPLPHLALYRSFDLGPAKLGASIAYRAVPSLVVLREGLLSEERGFRSVDVIVNERRVLRRTADGAVRSDPHKAVAIGVWETAIEALAHDGLLPADRKVNTFAVFEAARRQDIARHLLKPGSAGAEAQLSLGDDAEAALAADLQRGFAALVPERLPEGQPLAGWWRIDPETGSTLGMTEDGRGQELVEHAILVLDPVVNLLTSIKKYRDCDQYRVIATKACCLVEAHMSNIGGMALGGALTATFGDAVGGLCGAAGTLRGQVAGMAGTTEEWSCSLYDKPDKLIGSGSVVNTSYFGCGALQEQ